MKIGDYAEVKLYKSYNGDRIVWRDRDLSAWQGKTKIFKVLTNKVIYQDYDQEGYILEVPQDFGGYLLSKQGFDRDFKNLECSLVKDKYIYFVPTELLTKVKGPGQKISCDICNSLIL